MATARSLPFLCPRCGSRARGEAAVVRGLSHFRHGFTADDPALGLKAVVNGFIVSAQGVDRHAGGRPGETAGMQAAVYGRAHMADDVGTHEEVTLRSRGRGQL